MPAISTLGRMKLFKALSFLEMSGRLGLYEETLTLPGTCSHLWFTRVRECPLWALLLVPKWQCISSFVFYIFIWRALSKPPQRRQGPDPRPLWLLVGTPPAFGPEIAYRLRVAQPILMDVPYIFLIYYSIYFCTTFLWPLRFVWLLVSRLF